MVRNLKINHRKIISILAVSLIALLLIGYVGLSMINAEPGKWGKVNLRTILQGKSVHRVTEDVIVFSTDTPWPSFAPYALIATPIACHYGYYTGTVVKPLLASADPPYVGDLPASEQRFLSAYSGRTVLLIGIPYSSSQYYGLKPTAFYGDPMYVSFAVAEHEYYSTSGALIISNSGYELGVAAATLASYLDIPILVIDSNSDVSAVLNNELQTLHVQWAITVGDVGSLKLKVPTLSLMTSDAVSSLIVQVIKAKFGFTSYITLTNPSDINPPPITTEEVYDFSGQLVAASASINLLVAGATVPLVGTNIADQQFAVGDGLNLIRVAAKLNMPLGEFIDTATGTIIFAEPTLVGYIYDPQGNFVAYAPSVSYSPSEVYMEAIVNKAPGAYKLVLGAGYGVRTEFIRVNVVSGTYEAKVTVASMSKPHWPLIPNLSMLAPYLTAAHGGMLLADSNFEESCPAFRYGWSQTEPVAVNGSAQKFVNQKVMEIKAKLNKLFDLFRKYGIYEQYLFSSINGRAGDGAFLAILADSNMVPMYYYEPYFEMCEEGRGVPTDAIIADIDNNIPTFDLNVQAELSVGRPISRNLQDTASLIARTIFYQKFAEQYRPSTLEAQVLTATASWKDRALFTAGSLVPVELWQLHSTTQTAVFSASAFTVSNLGTDNPLNDRDRAYPFYQASNYIDLCAHGFWYWYVPGILYSPDYIATAFDVAHVKDFELGPSMIWPTSCVTGRIDSLPGITVLSLAFTSAGANAYIGGTRSEAGWLKYHVGAWPPVQSMYTIKLSEYFEDFAVQNDISVGGALRKARNMYMQRDARQDNNLLLNQEIDYAIVTYLVEQLYGDPAFNPYEPVNGYSSQSVPQVEPYIEYPIGQGIVTYVFNGTALVPTQTDAYNFSVLLGATKIEIWLNWSNELSDLDLYLYDPNGNEVGSSAGGAPQTSEHIEITDPSILIPGIWNAEVYDWLAVNEEYTVTITVTYA